MHSKPLYCWVLEALIHSELVDQIVINTDAADLIINNPLVSHGKVALVERHVKLIGDEVSMDLIIESDLNSIDGDQFLMTHVTNPLVQSKPTIEQFVNFVQICKMEHLTVCSLSIKCKRILHWGGTPISHDPRELLPTQCLTPIYKENSNIYIFIVRVF